MIDGFTFGELKNQKLLIKLLLAQYHNGFECDMIKYL
jgi:hypothetical protein